MKLKIKSMTKLQAQVAKYHAKKAFWERVEKNITIGFLSLSVFYFSLNFIFAHL